MIKRLFSRPQPVEAKQATMPAMMFMGVGQPAAMARDYAAFSKEGYAQNTVVNACVNKIAKAIGSVKLEVCRDAADGVEVLEDHPLNNLLYRPNPTCGGASFMEALASYLQISGNVYISRSPITEAKLNTPPNELWLLAPERVKVLAGEAGIPSGYEYDAGQGRKVKYPVDLITGKSDILHIALFNPLSGHYGMSPIEAAADSVDTFNAAVRWNNSLVSNSGRPSGAFEIQTKEGHSAELTNAQYSRIREDIEKNYTGTANAGRPMLLEGGLKWVEMGINPKDMDFVESLLMSARFIASAFGVPPQLINIKGESTYSNYREAKEAFWTDTVLPLLDSILDELNYWLPQQFGDEGIYLKYDEDNIPALEEKRESRFNRISTSQILTLNEKREMLGFAAYDGGDVMLVPTGQVPIDLLSDDPVQS